jgi:UDP-N-acetylmuramoyl-L-alanyl-D-glutamate--2,6-diaminopimelate ligase
MPPLYFDQLLSGVELPQSLLPELAQSDVRGLDYDSRRIQPGFAFWAFAGANADGRMFAEQALSRGAVGVVSELPPPPGFPQHMLSRWVRVPHARQALALAARNFYGPLSREIALIGITGTNGKTTTCYLVDSILRAARRLTAMVGTVEYRIGERVFPAVNTTPESLDLYRILTELLAQRASPLQRLAATIEVSSHALHLGRVWGLEFHTAVFSNLSRDHLDYHQTMEAYFEAKAALFHGQGGRPPAFAVINRDDPYGSRIHVSNSTQVYWYGLGEDARVRAQNIESSFNGIRFEVTHGRHTFPVESRLVSRVNVYNILAAAATGLSLGIAEQAIQEGIALAASVPGRFELIEQGQPFLVVVDYAHTDDALRNLIANAHALEPRRVLTLFGCGGDRDRTKRPLMARAAAEASDFVLLTSDNPRSEDPLAIIEDALPGFADSNTPYEVEPERAKAIARILALAEPGDIVLIAGKGHETHQVLKSGAVHFDDREFAAAALESLGYRKPRSAGADE